MPTTHLPDRGVVRVAGEDAGALLQGLLTNDLDGLTPGHARFAGLLTPQGKILFDVLVVATPSALLLDGPRALAPDLAKRLTFYRLRAKADIADVSATHAVFVGWGDAMAPAGAVADPRHPALGWRAIVEGQPPLGDADPHRYQAYRIALGVPEGGADYAWGDTFPHEALYDRLAGVSFTKGCYVGQEIVSRMQHRGTARKRILQVRSATPMPPPGTPVTAGEATIGVLGSNDGAGTALAMLRVDRAIESRNSGTPLRAGACDLAVDIPAWAVPAPHQT